MPLGFKDIRRAINTKQDMIEFNGIPSPSSMVEGQVALHKKSNSLLALYRKKFGKLWKTYLSADGNQIVDKNLTIKDSLKVDRNTNVNGITTLNKLIFSKGSNLTIASDTITPTHSFHALLPQSGSSDDLDTINGGVEGQILVLMRGSGTITIKHDEDNINTIGGSDFAMNSSNDVSVLLYNGGIWHLIVAANI